MTFDPTILKEGDCLLYKAQGVFGWIISIKTWHPLAHCESYIGIGQSVASRDGLGVDAYPLRTEGLAMVLRPVVPFSQPAALHWFLINAKGQKYDWLGLLRFAWRAEVIPDDGKMFCSEFLTRWYRAGGLDPFPNEDADAVPPYLFSISPVFRKVWSAADDLAAISASVKQI